MNRRLNYRTDYSLAEPLWSLGENVQGLLDLLFLGFMEDRAQYLRFPHRYLPAYPLLLERCYKG
jgi:hypothetical protein